MTAKPSFSFEKIRNDFPCLHQHVHNKPLVYFDTAATAQKPIFVTNAISDYYKTCAANVNRGAHFLSEQATLRYQDSRKQIARFINAHPKEVVFTKGTTESINLVAHGLSKILFNAGDEIILTEMEHHSNIVPWYLVAQEKGLHIKVAPILDDGTLDIQAYKNLFTSRTKLAAFCHVSNALGTINPIKQMVAIAQEFAVPTLIDGAQAIPHIPVDVKEIGADFYCFSGHKVYGPTGIGVLYVQESWLVRMPPYQGGGDMIQSVSFDDITYAEGPQKFEAGTPNIAGALGLKAALDYIDDIGLDTIHQYEMSLHDYLIKKLNLCKRVRVIGNAPHKVSLVSFIIDGVHPHDISSILDRFGIAIRAGHLCAQPLMKRFNISALSRVSLSFYNTREEVDLFIEALNKVSEVFKL